MAAESPPRAAEFTPLDALPPRTVFFDGVCNFCDHTVRWVLERDPSAALHFAPLQGGTAEHLRAHLPGFPDDQDGIVYVDASGEVPVTLRQSTAIFEILAQIEGPARHWRVLRFLPRWLTDLGYRVFARWRYRVFGKLDSCALPPPEVRARFLP